MRVLEAPAVADPAVVDLDVLAGRHPHQFAPALPEVDVAADSAARADAGGVVHVPGSGLEAPDARRQCADRAEVDDVAAEDRLQRLVELRRDVGLNPSLVGGQLLLPGDFVVIARAAVAEHAALAVEGDPVTDRERLGKVQARLLDPAHRIAVAVGEVLQRALAAFVADRAVQGVVGELELQDVGAGLDRHGRRDPNRHAFRDRCGAGGLRARRARAQLDQAEPAGADRVELVVVAEDGYFDSHLLRRLDD